MRESVVSAFVALICAVIGTGGAVQFFLVRAKRRQIDTNASVSLSDGALRRVTAAETSAAKAEDRANEAFALVDQMRREQAVYNAWAVAHQSWDAEAVTEVTRLGGHLRPAPQLNLPGAS